MKTIIIPNYNFKARIIAILMIAFGIVGFDFEANAQCTGCSSTISTDVAGGFTANGQTICITSSTYTSNFNFGGGTYNNTTLCIASNVNWSGNTFTQGGNPSTINLYGNSSYNFTGWNGINTGVILNIAPTGVYTGQVNVSSGGTVNINGTFNPSSSSNFNNTNGVINISSSGLATIPGGSVSENVINQGNLYLGSSVTFGSGNLTLGGTVFYSGSNNSLFNGAQVLITGNVTLSGAGINMQNVNIASGGVLNIIGSANINGPATVSGNLNVTGNLSNTSPITVNNGNINVTGVLTNSGGINGSGSGCGFLCGGTITGTSTYGGSGSNLSLCATPVNGYTVGANTNICFYNYESAIELNYCFHDYRV
jgi:hypothetical protein